MKREKIVKKVETMRNKMIGGWAEWKLSLPVQNLASLPQPNFTLSENTRAVWQRLEHVFDKSESKCQK